MSDAAEGLLFAVGYLAVLVLVELVDLFRAGGHDAVTTLDQNLEGAWDSELASVCRREGRAIVTLEALAKRSERAELSSEMG